MRRHDATRRRADRRRQSELSHATAMPPGPINDAEHGLIGAGLGLRREFLELAVGLPAGAVDFLELAPENWMRYGGRLGRLFREITERIPVAAHGLSLSLGGPAPLDRSFLTELKQFLTRHSIRLYSEHLSFCSDDGHLYDLLPIPFTAEAASYVAERIRCTQDILQRRIAIENVTYYATPGQEMAEAEFIAEVLEQADCDLLLDVNNVYVNSINHGYDASAFIRAMPVERIACVHVAGHYRPDTGLLVDTHGAAVISPVWTLLAEIYARGTSCPPTVLERDFNIPALPELLREVEEIRAVQAASARQMLRCA